MDRIWKLRYPICMFPVKTTVAGFEAHFVLLRYAVLSISFKTNTLKADLHKYILCFRSIIAFIPLFGQYRSQDISG